MSEADLVRFGWRPGDEAWVTEIVGRQGLQVTSRYRLRVAEGPGEALRVTFEDIEILEAEGIGEAQLGQAGFQVPFYVGRDGRWIGLDEAFLPRTTPTFPMHTTTRRSDWNTWVQTWLGWNVAPGDRESFVAQVPLGSSLVETPILMQTRDLGDGRLRLLSVYGFDAQAMREAFEGTPVAEMTQRADVEKSVLVDAVVDPRGLRPEVAKCKSTTTVTPRVGPPDEQETLQEWRFEWSEATRRP